MNEAPLERWSNWSRSPDWATRVELGQRFEWALRPPESGLTEEEADELIQAFRNSDEYRIPEPQHEEDRI
jgi:hypothetical protein